MNDLDDARRDYLALRDRVLSAQIATLGSDGLPQSSYAPFARREHDYYMLLSGLAMHTQNLRNRPVLGLLLIEDEAQATNVFARKRISLQGHAQIVQRDDEAFARIMNEFHRRFGKIMQLIEPLPDFVLFRVEPVSGRFIRAFGQAYELSGEDLADLRHIDPREKN